MTQSLPALPTVKEAAAANDALAYTEPPPGIKLPKVKSLPQLPDTFLDFLARQSNASLEVRLKLSKFQRDEMDRARAESASGKFVGAAHFKMMLQHRFGTITAAWRQLMDPTGNGKVSFSEFCQCCRDLGYQRRMKQLWLELDTERKGWIGLDHLDPVSAELLRDFRQVCRQTYGDMLNSWNAFDRDKNHRLDLPEFEKCCEDVKFKGNAKKTFVALKKDVARKYLTIQDFDEKSMQCLYRGDTQMMTVKKHGQEPGRDEPKDGDTSPASSSSPVARTGKRLPTTNSQTTVNMEWIQACSKEQIRVRNENKKKRDEQDQGMKSLTALKRQLVANFGSIYSAWRQALDLDGNGRLSFGEFCIALRNLGYGGNVKDLFAALDRDTDGFIGLGDIDAKTDVEVNSYKTLAENKFPNILACWRESVNPGGSGQVDEKQFGKHCKELGWDGNTHSLFQNLKEEKSRKFLTLRDYDVRAYNAMNRGDMEMISEEKIDLAQLSKLPFQERQDNSFKQRWNRMRAKHDIEEMNQIQKDALSKDKGAQSVDALRLLLVRKYGTMTAAWKHGLDVFGNGRLPFGEFCAAVRRLGYNGDISSCFKQLDQDEKGSLTLRDLDEEAHEVVTEFRTLLLDKYGTYIKGWQAMDTNKNGSIEADEMAAACAAIGYQKAHNKLFKYLLDSPGKRNITMADLDPAAMQAFWRGDLEALSPMDKAKASLKARQDKEAEAKKSGMEACDWPTLKKMLIRKYGTITAAWREGLDVAGNGKLSFIDFSKQVRSFGFSGNIKQIFKELDDDNSGIISFNELDSNIYSMLSNFNELLLTKYSSYEEAWKALDDNGNNMVELHEFAALCADLNYQGSPKALFKQMLPNPLRKHMALDDLVSNVAIIQGNKADANSRKSMKLRTDSNMSKDELARRDLANRKSLEMKAKSMQSGSTNWMALKEQLIRKYGSITAAWRHALDWSGDGRLSYVEFCTSCRNNAFQGNISQAFKEIDGDGSGVVTFNEVDPEWYEKFKTFKDLLLKKHGTYELAWKAFDVSKNGQPGPDDLAQVCADVGYTEDPKELFKQLRKNQGVRYLTDDDFNSLRTFVSKAES